MKPEPERALRRLVRAITFLVMLPLFAGAAQADPQCRKIAFEGATYSICTLRADRDRIRIWHSNSAGAVYGGFTSLGAALGSAGQRLVFAMNAGMYHEDRSPVGLYIEDGVEYAPIVTRDGPGNFGLLPNGVFCLGDKRAAVIESRKFAANPPRCRFASQSGPMLVIDGKLHPRFLPRGTSLHIRNGVGVAADGVTLHFVISDDRVNFHDFGRVFRDVLKTPNALYFDGKVSRLYAPDLNRSDIGFTSIGPIVGAVVPR